MTLRGAVGSVIRSIQLSAVHRGTEFEERSMQVLQNSLSMSLRRVGGRADGGIDLQGWWWLPAEDSPLEQFTHNYRRLRVLVQCKREKKSLGPKHVREMEGVLHRNAAVQSSTPEKSSPPVVGILVSSSKFTKMATLHALSSPVPLVLFHLDVCEASLLPSSKRSKEKHDTISRISFASIVFNQALGGTNGLLHGNCIVRWEHATDKAGDGRIGLWWKGEKMRRWLPPQEMDMT